MFLPIIGAIRQSLGMALKRDSASFAEHNKGETLLRSHCVYIWIKNLITVLYRGTCYTIKRVEVSPTNSKEAELR